MAVGTTIELKDKVTGSLNRITASIYSTISAFQSVDRVSDQAFNPAIIQSAAQELYSYDQRVTQLEADLVDANRRIEQLQNETKQARAEADKLQDAFGMVGQAVAAIGIGYVVKEQVSKAIDYASDLTEVQNVVDTVFGDNSVVDAWAKNTLDAFGLNELSAKQFVGTMGAMLESSGMTGEAVEGMSMSLTELAGDMASFYNLDAEEAFGKIRSGISGETEPLKQLGINMSVANLEAYALAQGITTAYSEMSQAEQVALRYGYLMDATANAHGDFAKTSGSYANQIKLLKENWTGFTGELATNALPVLALGINMLNDAVSFISENWSIIQPIMIGLLAMIGLYTAALLIGKAVQLGAAVVTGIHTAMTTTWSAATFVQTVQQNGLNAALLAFPGTWIVAAIIAIIAAVVAFATWIAKATGVAETGFGVITGAIATAGAFIANVFFGILEIVFAVIERMVNPFINIANFIGNVFTNPVSSIIYLFADMADGVLSVLENIASAMDFIFGSDMAGKVNSWREGLKGKADELVAEYAPEENYEQIIDKLDLNLEDFGLERFNYGDSFKAGAAWGDGIAEDLANLFNPESLLADDNATDPYTSTDDLVLSLLDDINGNTAATADSVDISNENLKYLRDSAEQEAINQFTTAEIKLDMTNNNNIASSMDIDGIVTQLSEGLREAMESAAEGVYA